MCTENESDNPLFYRDDHSGSITCFELQLEGVSSGGQTSKSWYLPSREFIITSHFRQFKIKADCVCVCVCVCVSWSGGGEGGWLVGCFFGCLFGCLFGWLSVVVLCVNKYFSPRHPFLIV